MFRSKYFFREQASDNDCAAACLSMIACHYGINKSIEEIYELSSTDREGTNIQGIIKASNALGFIAKPVKGMTQNAFASISLPCIAHVFVNDYPHFVVIYKAKKGKIMIADPSSGVLNLKYFWLQNEMHTEPIKYRFSGVFIIIIPERRLKTNSFNELSLLSKLAELFRPYKKLICSAFLKGTFFSLIISGILFFNNWWIYNNAKKYAFLGGECLFILLSAFALLCFFHMVNFKNRRNLTQNIGTRMSIEYMEYIIRLPIDFFERRKSKRIFSLFDDLAEASKCVSDIVFTSSDMLLVIVLGLIIHSMNKSFGIVLASFYSLFLFLKWWIEFNHKSCFKDVVSNMHFKLLNYLGSIVELKSKSEKNGVFFHLKKIISDYSSATIGKAWVKEYNVIINNCLKFSFLSGICVIATYFVLSQGINIIELLYIVILCFGMFESINNINQLAYRLNSVTSIYREIYNMQRSYLINDMGANNLENISNSISFKNVSFRYGTRKLTLNNLSFNISHGTMVAIVGEPGAGKTTIAKLLLKLYATESGQVAIDGIDINSFDTNSLRERIAYIPSNPYFFEGTVVKNLILGREDVVSYELIKATRMTDCFDFINKLPLKFQTHIEECGINFAPSERQRMALARACIQKSDVYIVDESIDGISFSVLNKIKKEMEKDKKVTFIVITNRIEFARQCNEILVMKDGRIVESGSHSALMEAKGFYSTLVCKKILF